MGNREDMLDYFRFEKHITEEQEKAWGRPVPSFFRQIINGFRKKDNYSNTAWDKNYPDIEFKFCENNKAWFRTKNW